MGRWAFGDGRVVKIMPRSRQENLGRMIIRCRLDEYPGGVLGELWKGDLCVPLTDMNRLRGGFVNSSRPPF